MAKESLYDVWWRHPAETEQSMEEEHQTHWSKVLDSIAETDLTEKSVLDFGCNQGGFLRFLYRSRPFKYGLGVDLATSSIGIANARKGSLPIDYAATDRPEAYREMFDLAFSISVIYLIQDLDEHARKLSQMLKQGGVYYAAYSDYSQNPDLDRIKNAIDQNAALPMLSHSLDEIAGAFTRNGFSCSVRRMLPRDFIAIAPEDKWFSSLANRTRYEYEECYLFRFVLDKQREWVSGQSARV